jgi:hypothetical protein
MPRGIGVVIQNVLPKAKFKGATKPGAKRKQFEGRQPKCLFAYAIQSDGKDVCFASRQSPTAIRSILSSNSHLHLMALALLRFGWF